MVNVFSILFYPLSQLPLVNQTDVWVLRSLHRPFVRLIRISRDFLSERFWSDIN